MIPQNEIRRFGIRRNGTGPIFGQYVGVSRKRREIEI